MSDGLVELNGLIEFDVGPVAHGGHCVARIGDDPRGRVVFVRHALPGERVRAVVTDDPGGGFCRADAVEVLRAAPDRVAPPCPHSGPGRCGGCDWQHASGPAQRELKAAVVREQLQRLAGLDLPVTVEELPGGLLGWRTRILYAVDRRGTVGLRRHRSHQVEPLTQCPLGVPGVATAPAIDPGGLTGIELVDGPGGVTVLEHRPGPARRGRGRRPPDEMTVRSGRASIGRHAGGRSFAVAADGFWQVHPAAADLFQAAVLDLLRPQHGERVLDLYCGAGLLTAGLAEAVGGDGAVVGVEVSRSAVADARANLADLSQASVRRASVSATVVAELAPADLVVLDPPRSGAGGSVMTAIVSCGARAIAYVACDPAALARDLATAIGLGWRVVTVRAFDAFPMTHHVECVALLVSGDAPATEPVTS